MYPQADLDVLAHRKRTLLISIRARRHDCTEQFGEVMRPFMWADALYARWKRIAPVVKIAAVSLGLMLKRKLFPDGGLAGGLIRWGPLVLNFFRSKR